MYFLFFFLFHNPSRVRVLINDDMSVDQAQRYKKRYPTFTGAMTFLCLLGALTYDLDNCTILTLLRQIGQI